MSDRARVIKRIIKKRLKFNKGAEIGVWKGETSKVLLECFPTLKLICVDPYKTNVDDPAQFCTCKTQKEFDELYDSLVKEFEQKWPGRTMWIRKISIEAVTEVEDSSLDFVFIDGNHCYDFVKNDIILWKTKIRRNGIICGHDRDCEAVHRAVSDTLGGYRSSGKNCWWSTKR